MYPFQGVKEFFMCEFLITSNMKSDLNLIWYIQNTRKWGGIW